MFSIDKRNAFKNFFKEQVKEAINLPFSNPLDGMNIYEGEENYEVEDDEVEDEEEDEEENKDEYKKEPYYFLHKNNNPLSTALDEVDHNKVYDIHVCIYKINQYCQNPFLEFLVDIENAPQFAKISNFSFPRIVDDDENITDTYFKNECITELLDIFNLDAIFSSEVLEKMYKGFVQHDEKNIFVVFEYFPDTLLKNVDKFQWVVLDEILFKRTINHIEIDDLLISFFEKEDYMTEIFTDDTYLKQFPLPFLVYLCEKSETEKKYYNIPVRGDKISLMDFTTVGVSWLGDYYYFSSNILDVRENSSRYVLFTENANYILKDISEITEQQIDTYNEIISSNDVVTTYYNDNGLSFWCVRNILDFTRI
jgi:hypothetical protein